jgi:hypothetical protein
MAHKRAFSKTVIDTDAFQDMPQTAQLLYFYLNMSADDDGFVSNPKRIMRAGGFGEDDLKILLAKRFLLSFESGVVVIKHWLIHNTLRKDRYQETTYLQEKQMLQIKENKAYTEMWQPNGNQLATQDKIKEDKIKEDKIKEIQIPSEQSSQVKEVLNIFYQINPTLNWGNKTYRKAAADLIKQFGADATLNMARQVVAVQGKPYAPVATNPYHLKEKLAQFKIYFDSQKNKSSFKVL